MTYFRVHRGIISCLIGLISGFLFRCGSSEGLLPPSHAESYTLLVSCDKFLWEGSIGDSLRAIWGVSIEGLPRREPLFKMLHVLPGELNSTLRRTAYLIEVVPFHRMSSRAFSLRRDVYARGQHVLWVRSSPLDSALSALSQHRSRLRTYFLALERRRLQSRIKKGISSTTIGRLRDMYGLSLDVPKEYEWAKEGENMVWLRSRGLEEERHLFFHYSLQLNTDIFGRAGAYRDSLMRQHLYDSEKPHLYISSQKEMPFRKHYVNLNGHRALMLRGLWKLSDNSMGGPFVGYLVADTIRGRLYYTEALLYAPSQRQRTSIGELDAMLHSFSFVR